ncbi:MAG: carbohydrate ABC transporter substrate-binding protein [Hungatella sp.]|nr:carbohydrate ABC transporter substrate-binding protein [Hungatella sp.]
MRRIYKKLEAWALAIGLAAGILGGCGRNQTAPEAGSTRPVQETTQGDEEKGKREAKEESREPGAKGRYRETEVKLPEEIENQTFLWFGRGEEGRLELFTMEWDTAWGAQSSVADSFRYVCKDGTWEKSEDWPGGKAAKDRGLDPICIEYGLDGHFYIGGVDESYRFHLLKMEEDGTANELLEEVFLPAEGSTYGMVPPRIQVLENENILIYDYWEVYLYEPSGRRLLSITKDFSGTTSDARGFYENQEFVTMQDGKGVRYDLKTGKITETIDCEEVTGDREHSEFLFGDGAGGIYMAAEAGLSHINRGGTMWEVLIDGSLTHMGMRSLSLRGFGAGDHDDYYGVFSEEGKGVRLFHYEYDPDMAAVPPSSLTVYSLQDNSTVRQAASQFQSQHPDVRVEVRTAVESGGTATEEIIQGLNTELLSGKGADILILDGLPIEAYVEKGILMDIRDIMAELENSGDMLNNILGGFKETDGCVYMIPARIGFPMIIGEEKAVNAYSGLKAMTEYQGEKPLLAVENYENLLRMTAFVRYEELFGTEKGLADRDTLIWYLKSVKAIGEASGCQTSFTKEEMEAMWVSNHVAPTGIVGRSTSYDAGRCDSGLEYMDGYGGLLIPAAVRDLHPESKMVAAGSVYMPSAMAGINNATANEELAKEFIRCLLSYDVQKEELYDGLPVNKKALKAIAEVDKPYSTGVGNGDYHISAEYPSLEVRMEVADMTEHLTVPAILDETVMDMVAEGSMEYFDGRQSVEEAADGILRKLAIYLAE